MVEIEGFILAGGASSRMGTDKAHLRLDGQTFVEKAACALRAVAARVSVVSSKPDSAAFGLPVIADVYENRGAFGGLHAALAHARAPWIAVVSCDLPFVTGEVFERFATFIGDDREAVAPLQPDGREQPLCALYARAQCLEVAEELLRAGELRPRVLLRRTRTRWVAFDELADLTQAELFFRNINTPEDYREALAAPLPGRGRES
jgi:molybdopterin-guanine dinucleotide biosynthesis protein A